MNEISEFILTYDFISEKPAIYATDSMPWEASQEEQLNHLALLQDKINELLELIEVGKLPQAQLEEALGKEVHDVVIEFTYYPNQAAQDMLNYFNNQLKEYNMSLTIISDGNEEKYE
ncbi:DUF6572 domain-containing protein [Mycoplasma sp. P36-A1]|uniref:DUF6572 domain-containing protein n=1 Tax=Mycoplasma sp. P36-A1 TaxID=3252900 RepID=UPI003C2FF98D